MGRTPGNAPRSTVVALVGADRERLLAGLDDLPALLALSLRETDPAVAAHLLSGARTPYVVHDADPLEHVAAAWVELYDERSTLGVLEAEVEDVLGRFAAGEAVMPDYYVVAGPQDLPGTWKHWWLGALAHRAPERVLPVEPTLPALRAQLKSLPASRSWPEPADWLPRLPFDVPDRVGLHDPPGA
ncbi:hypothetical protein [Agromyces seonyuensis]|uniref:Uncharacterized protein n=1 Tax=Agromyces seonyuensis TaxID=2662446 RepID=A0A6I4P0E1_9MICO|nr:hypothetical protein [Agromyces seonyuensis]MWB98205.1 hypothetical protein [Agromyces seonyuensis]